MISAKRVFAGFLAVASFGIACFGSLTPAKLSAAAGTNDTNDDWLHVEGNKIYDASGNEVWLTGANWFGFNCSECFPHGLWSADLSDTLESIANHGINFLRIPICTEIVYTWMVGNPAECVGLNPANDAPYYVFNPELIDPDTGECMDSLGVFNTLLYYCKVYGIKVMVDVHSPDSHNSGHNYPLWYGKDFTGITPETTGVFCTPEIWMTTWEWMAETYKNDDTLVAFDLKNEPHGTRGYTAPEGTDYAKWDDSTADNNWRYAAETCGNRILAINPNVLIMVEGIEVYPGVYQGVKQTWQDPAVWENDTAYYGAWWGGNLRGVADIDIDFGVNQDQLVYSPHDYGPKVYDQKWFYEGFTQQTIMDDYWYETWAYLFEGGKYDSSGKEIQYPLLIGEWGGHMDGDRNQRWLEIIRDYITENHIHHTFWCINPNSGDTGGLLASDFKTWDDEKYSLMELALWQDASGTYIGLDHQYPLGSNGMSLSDYYGSSPVQYYNVSTNPTGCTISASTISAQAGASVSFTVTPTVATPCDTTVSVKTTSGNTVSVSSAASGYSFTMPSENVTISATCTSQATERLYGDINGDGVVNATDATIVSRYAVGSFTLTAEQLAVADVNGDGNVNATDVTIILRYSVGTVAKLPIG